MIISRLVMALAFPTLADVLQQESLVRLPIESPPPGIHPALPQESVEALCELLARAYPGVPRGAALNRVRIDEYAEVRQCRTDLSLELNDVAEALVLGPIRIELGQQRSRLWGVGSSTILTYMSAVAAGSTETVDKVFRALADVTRLRILHLLQDGELCVSDIIEILRVPQARASHHLNYLHRAGLVEQRKQGLYCFYRLRAARSPFHVKLLECLGQGFTDVPALAADQKRAARVRASGGCCPP